MSYEQKYKDALNRAKTLFEGQESSPGRKKWIGEIFPELAESEDERIRKEILGFIDKVLSDKNVLLLVADRIGDDIPNMIPGWLAYLEKQKEQKSCSKGGIPPLNYYQGIMEGRSDVIDHPEKFGLQKPAEWGGEDEKIRKTLLDYYEKALDNYTCVEWLNGITYGELFDWLKSLSPRWKPSEEQMNFLLRLEGELRADKHPIAAKTLAEICEQLKALM